jgi:glutamate synthase domain-containing protein 2
MAMIARVREITGKPTGIKMCVGSEEGVAGLFNAIAARGADAAPDFITLDGGEGGTGAAPMPLIDLVGMSIREALPMVANLRNAHGLRDRIPLVASGKLVNPGDVAWALATGADFVTSARGFMFALGCIQALKCNRNTCPTGITTHNPRFQSGLVVEDKEMRVAAYAKEIIKEVETIAHSVGVAEPRLMRRSHVRVVQPDGRSILMSDLWPQSVSA